MKRTILNVLFAALLAANVFGDTVTLTLIPTSGTISGLLGSAVGWGYDITNNEPTDWVVLNDSFVTGGLNTGTYGTYVDYISSDFIVINPSSSTGDVDFSRGAPGTGTGEFDIDAFVPPTTIAGGISIDYSVFSEDPNSPNFDPDSLVSNGTVSANAQVNIVSPTPEPASAGLIIAALMLMGIAMYRRRSAVTATR
jgi:hypothetical protein